MAHTDIPGRDEIVDLADTAGPVCISIYTPTDHAVTDHDRLQLEFSAQVKSALEQIDDAEVRAALARSLEELTEWPEFWRFQSRTLVVLATTERVRTYRLPNRLPAVTEVGDRFYLKPMLRTTTFPQSAFVLALSENDARLVHVFADQEPTVIDTPDMPGGVEEFIGREDPAGGVPRRRLHAADSRKLRIRQYARAVDHALRPVLRGSGLPLVLAAAEPTASIFRAANSYPELLDQGIEGNPEALTPADLAAQVRTVLDNHYRDELFEIRKTFADRQGQGRAVSDVADAAKAATYGAVSDLLVNFEALVPGTIDPETGTVTFTEQNGADEYGVVDEIARRALLSGATVRAVRGEDMPNGEAGQVAALLRYPV